MKLLAYCVVTAVLGCASSPKTQDLSECRYGEAEHEVVSNLGIGSKIIYFRLGDNDYHYRSYVVGARETGPVYGLLFKNNKLSVMAKQTSFSFDACLDLNQSESWDACFSDSIRRMEEGRIDIATEEFTEGIAAEHRAAREDAIAYPVIVPIYVLIWPLTVLSELGRAPDYKAASECKKIPSRVIGLYPSATIELVAERLNELYPNLVFIEQNRVLDNRQVIKRAWRCGEEEGTAVSPLRFSPRVEVRFGFDANTMNWLYIRLQPASQRWPDRTKNESSDE